MDRSVRRRTRLSQLLDLAQNYRRWTRKELARSLKRDPTKLVPGSGVPKLDLVVDLSHVLDWPVDDVVAYLCGDDDRPSPPADSPSFEELDAAALQAHSEGEYHRMIELARKAFEAADSAEEGARACNREAGGWDGLGRYSNVLKAVQRGMGLSPVSSEFRRMLQANLANAYYTLFSLVEARAIAADLLRWFAGHPPQTMRDRKSGAFAHYVAGHTARRLIAIEPDRARALAESAAAELETACEQFEALAEETGAEYFRGIANTCRGGRFETDVVLGNCTAEAAMEALAAGIEEVGASCELVGDRLESYGWWCIFGCDIALRSLTNERDVQQYMAVFTNKADEIAERLDNWSIRERVFTMEHSRWERAVGCTGFDIPRVVDDEDVRVITGAMARFPTFHDTGWRILRSARVVRSS